MTIEERRECISPRSALEPSSTITPVLSLFSSAMDPGAYGRSQRSRSSLQMKSSSGRSVNGVVEDPSSDAGPFPQELYFEDEGPQMNCWPQDTSLNMHDPQVNEEPYRSGHYPPTRPTPAVRDIDGRIGIPRPENLIGGIHEEDLPVIHPSDTVHLATASPWPTQSVHSSYMPPTAIGLASVDMSRGRHQQGITTNAPVAQGSRYTPTATTTNSSVPAVVPPGSSRGPVTNGIGRAPAGRYSCNICGRSYSQSQGLRRHQRERHDASLCTYCGVFEWGRPYRLREHLEEAHPDVDIEAALDEAARTRRRATSLTSHHGD